MSGGGGGVKAVARTIDLEEPRHGSPPPLRSPLTQITLLLLTLTVPDRVAGAKGAKGDRYDMPHVGGGGRKPRPTFEPERAGGAPEPTEGDDLVYRGIEIFGSRSQAMGHGLGAVQCTAYIAQPLIPSPPS